MPEAVRSAVEHLELLGAVERKDGQVLLTALGKKMASFPLEPRYAKVNRVWKYMLLHKQMLLCPPLTWCDSAQRHRDHTHDPERIWCNTSSPYFPSVSQTILLSPDYSCSEEILSIVSLLSVDTVLYNPPARREEVLAARKKFSSSEGDHMTLLNIYRAFKKVSGNKVTEADEGEKKRC